MSESQHVFAYPPALSDAKIVATLTELFRPTDVGRAGGTPVLVIPVNDDRTARVEVGSNLYGQSLDPDDRTAIEGFPLDLQISDGSDDRGRESARFVFDQITERLHWAAALVHGLESLIADYTPALGTHEYPAGTSIDPEDRAAWGPRRAAIG